MKSLSLKNKKIFVFDWDGTLLDSMSIKANNFIRTIVKLVEANVKNKPELSKDIDILYREFSGLPRKILYENVIMNLGLNVSSFNYSDFDREFTELNKSCLINANIFNDAYYFLNYLIRKDKILFISSSVPQEELNYFTNKIIDDCLIKKFSGIFGSEINFSKGKEHIRFILKETGHCMEELVFIGDDIFDYNLSRQAGADFILINRKKCVISDENICHAGSLAELEVLIDG